MMKKYMKSTEFLLLISIVIFISISVLQNIYPSSYFYPINGNFQNFNVVRRLFAGYIPFQDFPVYFGPLHLYLGAFFTKILGGTFVSSVAAFSLLSTLTYVFLMIIIAMSMKMSRLTGLVLIAIMFCVGCFFDIFDFHYYVLSSGNSARLLRGLPLFIAAFFIIIIENKVKGTLYIKDFLYGCVAGFVFPCSNDWGISSFLAISIYFFIIKIFSRTNFRSFVKSSILYSLGLVIVFLCSVALFSQGHVASWFNNTFGIGSYQSWYFLGSKVFRLWEFDLRLIPFLQIVFTLFLLYQMCLAIYYNKSTHQVLKYKVLYLLNSTACIVTQELNFLSSRNYDVPLIIFVTSIVFYFCNETSLCIELFSKKIQFLRFSRFFRNLNNKNKKVIYLVILLLIYGSFHELKSCFSLCKEVSIPSLGGTLSSYSKDVLDVAKFVGDKKVFSTYSSALEVLTNQFQPSGYDYIIHVLGNNARIKYLASFNQRNFSYVSTQKNESTDYWETWIQNANWYFYRLLYRYYVPVYFNKYLVLWSEASEEDYNNLPPNTSITYVPLKARTGNLIIKTDPTINGIAELKIGFEIEKKLNISFIFRKLLLVRYDTSLLGNIKDQSLFYIYLNNSPNTIPVPIINGYGEVHLKAFPNSETRLKIKSIEAQKYYKRPFSFIEVKKVDVNSNVLKIKHTLLNVNLLKNVKKIKINNRKVKVLSQTFDKNMILLKVDKLANEKVTFLEILE